MPLIELDFADITRIGKPDDVLVHLATSNIIYAMDYPIETFNNNALKTIELFRKWQGKIVYTSTSSVYGNADVLPTDEQAPIKVYNAYDTSKRIAELYLMKRGNYTTLRLSNVYGENQIARNPYCGIIGKMIHCALTKTPFSVYGSGMATRDYTYVGDVVDAIIRSIERKPYFEEFNIGTDVETSVMDLVRMVQKATGKPMMLFDEGEREIDIITRRRLDINRAKFMLGWSPQIRIEQGIEITAGWYAKHLGRLSKEVLRETKRV
jgi:UDP-glucose 4-epimerase